MSAKNTRRTSKLKSFNFILCGSLRKFTVTSVVNFLYYLDSLTGEGKNEVKWIWNYLTKNFLEVSKFPLAVYKYSLAFSKFPLTVFKYTLDVSTNLYAEPFE